MGRALTPDECLREAQECLELATNAPDADLRNGLLDLARTLTELATRIDAEPISTGTGGIPGNTTSEKEGSSPGNR